MPARKRKNGAASGIGSMSAKQMKRKKPINTDLMVDILSLTENQTKFFDYYKEGKNLFSYGAAGTGKTFKSLCFADEDDCLNACFSSSWWVIHQPTLLTASLCNASARVTSLLGQ